MTSDCMYQNLVTKTYKVQSLFFVVVFDWSTLLREKYLILKNKIHILYIDLQHREKTNCMVIGFITIYAISAYHH